MFRPLRSALRRAVGGNSLLVVYDAAGERHAFGDPSRSPVVVRLADRATERALAFDPSLALGEAYMGGRLTIERGTIYDLLELAARNANQRRLPPWSIILDRSRRLVRRVAQINPTWRARRNVAHHYDIDRAVYDLFLDPDRQYSCAYFVDGADLVEAQRLKKQHIAAKLVLAPGQRVLDIGCGWGGLALWLAREIGCEVKGITLSAEQLQIARERAANQGLGRLVHFDLEDYRRVTGRFDRIVSVGMFEHVGLNHYDAFFAALRDRLADDGVALLHSIGRLDGPGFTNPFIAKYIFPGGYFPALSEVLPAIERSGLIVSDIEILRLHYAETLKAWRERFLAARGRAAALRGEEFCRMWEFYLAGSEAAFRHDALMVFQIQLIRRIDTLPITRDYMFEEERRLARLGASGVTSRRLAGE
jgi:cyclopropane-fatty-acyl-phospholipid synthase